MVGLSHFCPTCRRVLTPTLVAPAEPDFWLRPDRQVGWTFSKKPPTPEERASVLSYRCGACNATFRIAIPAA